MRAQRSRTLPRQSKLGTRKAFLEVLLELILEEQLEDSQVVGRRRKGEEKKGEPHGHPRHLYSSLWFAKLIVYLGFLIFLLRTALGEKCSYFTLL